MATEISDNQTFTSEVPYGAFNSHHMTDDSNKRVFALIHGAWHAPEHWDYLKHELENQGHTVICPRLPIDDPNATSEDDTNTVIDAINEYEQVFLVAHSRGVEVIPRLYERQGVDRFIGAAILNSGGPHSYQLKNNTSLPRYNDNFLSGIRDRPDGLTEFDEIAAIQVFYNCVRNSSYIRYALEHLRPQRYPSLIEEETPSLPKTLKPLWVIGKHDRVHNAERSEKVAREWGQTEPIIINSDHSPQLSMPNYLANLLLSYSSKTNSRGQ